MDRNGLPGPTTALRGPQVRGGGGLSTTYTYTINSTGSLQQKANFEVFSLNRSRHLKTVKDSPQFMERGDISLWLVAN